MAGQIGRLSGEEMLSLLDNLESQSESDLDNVSEFGLNEISCPDEVVASVAKEVVVASQSSDVSDNEENESQNDKDYVPNESDESDDERTEGTQRNTCAGDGVEKNNDNFTETGDNDVPGNDEIRGRKRKRNYEKWKVTERKMKSARGESFTNWRGKTIASKSPQINQPCSCKKHCLEMLGEDCIKRIFKEFGDLADKKQQDHQLFGLIQFTPVKRRRPTSGSRGTYRQGSYKYFVRDNEGTLVNICPKAFMIVHCIGKSRFERLRQPNQTTPDSDKRGKHQHHPKVDGQIKDQVRDHIRSFPKRQSHYSRQINPNRSYLHENLNVRRMWMLYLKQHEPEQLMQMKRKEPYKVKVKLWLYRQIFLTEFNLSFGAPRTDTCSTCDRLNSNIEDAINSGQTSKVNSLKQEQEMHHRKAETAYEKLKTFSQSNEHTDAYSFDFQQNLPLPCISSSDMFYSRMLWVFNFGIHDLTNGDGIMHIWDETTGKRGSSEVCSCLKKTILKRKTTATRLVLFSDSCGGQNKNKAIIAFLSSLIAARHYNSIDHFFLVRGHTFLPNDRDFALIEKAKRGEVPMLPQDYTDLIEKARSINPFLVEKMAKEDFVDHKAKADAIVTTSFKDQRGKKVKIREVMWYSYGSTEEVDPISGGTTHIQHPTQVWCRYTHSDFEPWKKVSILKRGSTLEHPAAMKYTDRLPLKQAKYNDLATLCRKGLIPFTAKEFYLDLPHDGTATVTDEAEEYFDDYQD